MVTVVFSMSRGYELCYQFTESLFLKIFPNRAVKLHKSCADLRATEDSTLWILQPTENSGTGVSSYCSQSIDIIFSNGAQVTRKMWKSMTEGEVC